MMQPYLQRCSRIYNDAAVFTIMQKYLQWCSNIAGILAMKWKNMSILAIGIMENLNIRTIFAVNIYQDTANINNIGPRNCFASRQYAIQYYIYTIHTYAI